MLSCDYPLELFKIDKELFKSRIANSQQEEKFLRECGYKTSE